jgi:hypothetical protein
MQLQTTIDATTRVSAQLEGAGALRVTVFAQAAYAPGRTTTAAIEIAEIPEPLRAELARVLTAIHDQAAPALGPRLQRAIAKSAEIAAQMGEG